MSVRGQLTRWVVLGALSVATVLVLGVSVRGNYLYGHSLGQTDEKKLLFAWANVGIDLWKSFGLIALTLLWRTKQRRLAFGAALSWALCLVFGVNSALGLYVQDRSALIGGKRAAHATYLEAEAELAATEEKLRGRVQRRTTREIESEIASILARAVLTGDRLRGSVDSISQHCTRLDTRTRDACERVFALRREHASAMEAEALEARATALRRALAGLRESGGAVAPDPVAEFYTWLTGGFVGARDVGFGFPLFFALLIEAVSTFGPATIVAYAEASRPTRGGAARQAVTSHGEPKLVAAWRDGLQQSVLEWIAARAVPTASNRALGLSDLYADYVLWCSTGVREVTVAPLFEEAFDAARQLPELHGKIRKFGHRYYGIDLVRPRSVAGGSG
jgi:hypothetical protein